LVETPGVAPCGNPVAVAAYPLPMSSTIAAKNVTAITEINTRRILNAPFNVRLFDKHRCIRQKNSGGFHIQLNKLS
jgi:hypothetical protein